MERSGPTGRVVVRPADAARHDPELRRIVPPERLAGEREPGPSAESSNDLVATGESSDSGG